MEIGTEIIISFLEFKEMKKGLGIPKNKIKFS